MRTLFHILLLILFVQLAYATNYTVTSSGDWTDTGLWSPSYPGLSIAAGDTVFISAAITLDNDINNIIGTLVIQTSATLTGTHAIDEIDGSIIINTTGSLNIEEITKVNGSISNFGTLTLSDDLKVDAGGTVTSSGAINAKKIKVEDNSSSIVNSGTLILTDGLEIKDGASATNSGSISAKKIKVEDTGSSFISSSIVTTNGNFEVKDGATALLSGILNVGNDLKIDDAGSSLVLNAIANIEDDLKVKNGSITGAGGINICDNSGGEAQNLLENTGTINLTLGICMCASNIQNTVNNTGTIIGGIFDTNCNTPLPVELRNFSARVVFDYVQVTWQTASEFNNKLFSIEKSWDGQHFEIVGQINGKGTTQQSNTYQFSDPILLTGRVYYRLKQTDFNGQYSYSKVIQVSVPLKETIKVWPNPTSGDVHISSSVSVFNTVHIFNNSGQEVHSSSNLSTKSIEIIDLPPGLYIIVLTTNKSRVSKRLIVN